jgi:hypothetical protein
MKPEQVNHGVPRMGNVDDDFKGNISSLAQQTKTNEDVMGSSMGADSSYNDQVMFY